MPTISALPDDCLRELFRRLSLQECVRLRGICRRWLVLIGERCQKQSSLKLFGSKVNVQQYCQLLLRRNQGHDEEFKLKPIGEDDDLVWRGSVSHDDAQLQSQFVVRLFPRIERLVLLQCSLLDLAIICRNYGPQLTSLFIADFRWSCQSDYFRLWPLLQAMCNLRSLHFFNVDFCLPTKPMNLLQLERLSLTSFNVKYSALLYNSCNLTQLAIDATDGEFDDVEFRAFFTLNPKIAFNIKQLVLRSYYLVNYHNIIDTIAVHFTALTSLRLHLNVDWDETSNLLWLTSRLTRLTHLRKLSLKYDAYLFNVDDNAHLRPIKSVYSFELQLLYFEECSAKRFYTSVFTAFPCLTSLRINAISAPTCRSQTGNQWEDYVRLADQHSPIVRLCKSQYWTNFKAKLQPLMGKYSAFCEEKYLIDDPYYSEDDEELEDIAEEGEDAALEEYPEMETIDSAEESEHDQ